MNKKKIITLNSNISEVPSNSLIGEYYLNSPESFFK